MESAEYLIQALIDAGDYIVTNGPPAEELDVDHPLYGMREAWNSLMASQSEEDQSKVGAILSGFMIEPVVSVTLVAVFMHAAMRDRRKASASEVKPQVTDIPEAFFDTLEEIDMMWREDGKDTELQETGDEGESPVDSADDSTPRA